MICHPPWPVLLYFFSCAFIEGRWGGETKAHKARRVVGTFISRPSKKWWISEWVRQKGFSRSFIMYTTVEHYVLVGVVKNLEEGLA